MALCEQIVSIDVNVQIERVVASISDTELLDKITECVKIQIGAYEKYNYCLLYTSDAADE